MGRRRQSLGRESQGRSQARRLGLARVGSARPSGGKLGRANCASVKGPLSATAASLLNATGAPAPGALPRCQWAFRAGPERRVPEECVNDYYGKWALVCCLCQLNNPGETGPGPTPGSSARVGSARPSRGGWVRAARHGREGAVAFRASPAS